MRARVKGVPTRAALLIPGLILAALASPAVAAAQTAGEAGARLSLDEAIVRAQANNPAYQRVLYDLQLSDIENRAWWLSFLPQPQLSLLSTNMQWNRTAVGQDPFGNPIPNPEFRMLQSASSSQSASLNFQTNFQSLARRQVTKLQAESREVATVAGAHTLASDVRLAFLDAQERLESRELEESLLGVRRTNQEITEGHFRLARADRPELLSAELDAVEQEFQLEQSRAALRSAILKLGNVIADPDLGEFEIVPAPLRVFDPATLDGERLVAIAVSSGPRVQQAQLSVRQAERQVAVERAGWLPTLSLNAGTGRHELSRGSGSGFFQPLPDADWNRIVSITLSFPDLGRYFSRQLDASRAHLQVRTSEQSLREARIQVEEEVRSNLVDLTNQYRSLLLQERRAELARERLELEQERYRLGRIDYLALQNSVEAAAGAQRQVLQARYGFERALIRLEQSLGAPIPVPVGSR